MTGIVGHDFFVIGISLISLYLQNKFVNGLRLGIALRKPLISGKQKKRDSRIRRDNPFFQFDPDKIFLTD